MNPNAASLGAKLNNDFALGHEGNDLVASDIEPPLRGPDIGEVRDPFAVGSRSFEAAVEHVCSDGGRLPLTQVGRQPTPSWNAAR